MQRLLITTIILVFLVMPIHAEMLTKPDHPLWRVEILLQNIHEEIILFNDTAKLQLKIQHAESRLETAVNSTIPIEAYMGYDEKVNDTFRYACEKGFNITTVINKIEAHALRLISNLERVQQNLTNENSKTVIEGIQSKIVLRTERLKELKAEIKLKQCSKEI